MSRPSGDRFIARRVFMSIGIARSPSRRYEQRAQRKNTSGVTCSSFNHVGRSVARRLGSDEVIDVLADVRVTRGIPDHVRSDNGPEFIALRLRQWLADVGAQTLYIEPGSPWENGYCESFNRKLRDEFLNGEIFYSLKEAQILTERWRVPYNTVRPHSSLGYRPPAPMAYRLAMPPPSESRSVPSAVM